MTVGASAPGKLILIGEYGVLFGSPAVVMAVDRRAYVKLDVSGDTSCRVDSPGLGWDPARFTVDPDGGLRWRSTPEVARRYLLLERVLGSMSEAGLVLPEALMPFSVTLDSRAFFHNSGDRAIKLGLGSSAALTVALAAALFDWSGTGEPPQPGIEWLQRLLRLHRGLQGGRGSGVDLAASLMGGVVEYRLDSGGDVAAATPLDLPAGLGLAVVWTGRSAETGEFLDRLSRRMSGQDGSSEIENALGRLGGVATDGVLALGRRDAPSFLTAVDAFAEGMENLGRTAGLDIVSREHIELGRLARRCGVSYKPSGAGGGDIGIGLSLDPEALNGFVRTVSKSGFHVLDISLDPCGLR